MLLKTAGAFSITENLLFNIHLYDKKNREREMRLQYECRIPGLVHCIFYCI